MTAVPAFWLLGLVASLAAAQVQARERLVVMELQPGADVTTEVAAGFTEAVASAAASAEHYTVVSSAELQTMMGVERQRQLMGCADDACMTEIGSALGARYLLRGSVGRLGASFQLALQLVDTRRAETVSRSTRLAPTLEALREKLPWAVAIAAGLPPPPPPSRVPALSALLGGGALLVAGAAAGGFALIEDAALSREQTLAVPGALGTRESYASARTRLGMQKTASLVGLVAGAGLLGLGVFLWPVDPSQDALALHLGPGSVAFSGVFP